MKSPVAILLITVSILAVSDASGQTSQDDNPSGGYGEFRSRFRYSRRDLNSDNRFQANQRYGASRTRFGGRDSIVSRSRLGSRAGSDLTITTEELNQLVERLNSEQTALNERFRAVGVGRSINRDVGPQRTRSIQRQQSRELSDRRNAISGTISSRRLGYATGISVGNEQSTNVMTSRYGTGGAGAIGRGPGQRSRSPR